MKILNNANSNTFTWCDNGSQEVLIYCTCLLDNKIEQFQLGSAWSEFLLASQSVGNAHWTIIHTTPYKYY